MSYIAIIEANPEGSVTGRLYRITRKERTPPKTEGGSQHLDGERERPTDTSTLLAQETLDSGWVRIKLPNKRIFLQIDGLPVEGYVPMRAKSGEVDIATYERVRYQTLRDGMLIEDATTYDGVFEILDPRQGLPSSYAIPAIIGENVIPEEPGGLGIRMVRYAYPKYYGIGAAGETLRVGLAYSHVNGYYQGKYAKYHDTTGVITGAYRSELPTPECGLVRIRYSRGVGGIASSRFADVGGLQYEMIKPLSEDDKVRVRNVINSLAPLNYELNGSADPSWLLNTVTSERGVARYLYLRGDIKGVYAKTLS